MVSQLLLACFPSCGAEGKVGVFFLNPSLGTRPLVEVTPRFWPVVFSYLSFTAGTDCYSFLSISVCILWGYSRKSSLRPCQHSDAVGGHLGESVRWYAVLGKRRGLSRQTVFLLALPFACCVTASLLLYPSESLLPQLS